MFSLLVKYEVHICRFGEADPTDCIMYRATRGRKLAEAGAIMNRAINRLRGKMEGSCSTLKRVYRFQRAWYLGCAKVKLDSFPHDFLFEGAAGRRRQRDRERLRA